MIESQQLKTRIVEAFRNIAYPGDDNLTECPCLECAEIADFFRGTTQYAHKVQDFRYHEAALNLLTDEALHYYLPAFVLAVMEDPETADVIYDGLIFIFTPSGSSRYQEVIQRLTLAQRETMIAYFRECLEQHGEYLNNNIINAIIALSTSD